MKGTIKIMSNTNQTPRAPKYAPLTADKVKLINIIKEANEPLTLAAISEAFGSKVAPGTITNLVQRGFIAKGEDVEVETNAKGSAKTYQVNADVAFPGTGKTEPTPSCKAVYDFLAANPDNAFTIAAVNEALGTDYKPGVFTALVKRGVVIKGDEVETTRKGKRSVGTYVFAKDPASTDLA